MKIIFCSMLFDDVEENLKKSIISLPMSGHIYQMSMIDGFMKNRIDFTVLNTQRVNRYPYYNQKKFKRTPYFFEGKELGINIPFNNRRILNFFSKINSLRAELCRIIERDKSQDYVVLVFNTQITILLAVLWVKFLHSNIKICASIGDIPGRYGASVQLYGLNKLKNNIINFIQRKLAGCFDLFVFVTEHMAKVLNVQSKPHIVVECLYKCDSDNNLEHKTSTGEYDMINDDNIKVVFYAGAVTFDYGIEHMLNSFMLIKDKNYLFFIAGEGDAVKLVKEFAKRDKRINYLGLISPEKVQEIESKSTVLISPRTSDKEFVKYSFPSKTFICLASGIPFIAHKLPCYSNEFDDYIQYPQDESDEALSKKIIEICELPISERIKIGSRGRQFIKNNMNHVLLTKKIIKMLRLG